MDKMLIVVLLIIYIYCASGLNLPRPEKLEVDMLDGEVIARWNKSLDAPLNCLYNVHMANYSGAWVKVDSCMGITETQCDLSSLIYDYRTGYKVKVELFAGGNMSKPTIKKFLPNESELRPPSFTLWPTSSTLTVYVHPKPILRKLFPFGPTYTIFMEEKGQDNKNTTVYMDVDVNEYLKSKTFTSLRWESEYCVSVQVEGKGALSISAMSSKQCVRLPEQEWFITAVTSLSILGVLAFAVIIISVLQCYLRSPEKTPAVLKSPVSGWHPVSVAEGTMEVVTDKGWFFSSYRTELTNCVKQPVTHLTVTEDKGDEDRRTSMDSGVDTETNSATNSRGSSPMRQEDSGCGSLGGQESSTGSQTVYPLQEERTDTNMVRKREDSGVGLGCQFHSSSLNLDGQDSGFLKEIVAGDNYRSQSPSAVHINVCDDVEAFKPMLPDSSLAEVVTGYRAGPQSCICSGAGQCTWCHKQGVYGGRVVKQYRAMCLENGLLGDKCDFVDSYKAELSGYSKKTQMDTVMMDDFETTFIQLGETFPLLTALTPLPLVEEGRDHNMNNVCLSLGDVQLITD